MSLPDPLVCPCCRCLTEVRAGEVCGVCGWDEDADAPLVPARAMFAMFGASAAELVGEVRLAQPSELTGSRPAHPLRVALAEHMLGLLRAEALPTLAVEALSAGLESPALVRLAGAVGVDADELRAEWEQALLELRVARPSPQEAMVWLAQDVAAEILDGAITAAGGAGQIWVLSSSVDHGSHVLDAFVAAASAWDEEPESRAFYAAGVRTAAIDLVKGRIGPVSRHPPPHGCWELLRSLNDPAVPVVYWPRYREYGIAVDGSSAVQTISHCPWCGTAFPSSLRDELFDRLERLGLDVDDPALPPSYRTDEWWHEGL